MARLKCACGLWAEVEETIAHRSTKEHAERMRQRIKDRMIRPQPSDQTREVLIPRAWRAPTD